jgi:hypothetical protein
VGLNFNGQAVQDKFFLECMKVQEISDFLLNVLLRIYFNCECSVMMVMVLLSYHVKTSSFILEINIFRFTITASFFFNIVEKVGYGFSENSGCSADQ